MAVVTLNIHHRGLRGCRVPPLIRTIVLGYLAKYAFYNTTYNFYEILNTQFHFFRVVFLKFDEEHEGKVHEKSNNLPMEENTKLGIVEKKAKLYPASATASAASQVCIRWM